MSTNIHTTVQSSDTPSFESTATTSTDDNDWVGGGKLEGLSLGGLVNLTWNTNHK